VYASTSLGSEGDRPQALRRSLCLSISNPMVSEIRYPGYRDDARYSTTVADGGPFTSHLLMIPSPSHGFGER
jgi:hypothetical protein